MRNSKDEILQYLLFPNHLWMTVGVLVGVVGIIACAFFLKNKQTRANAIAGMLALAMVSGLLSLKLLRNALHEVNLTQYRYLIVQSNIHPQLRVYIGHYLNRKDGTLNGIDYVVLLNKLKKKQQQYKYNRHVQ